jgi:hypothetical protein
LLKTTESKYFKKMIPRRSHNPKRHIREDCHGIDLLALARNVSYGGNPEHKRNPGDYGLTPPAQPRADKTLCDSVSVFKKSEAEALLREGVRRGLVSRRMVNNFPQNIWAVTEEGQPLEGQLENPQKGVYHGYPLLKTDPFSQVVLARWEKEGK